jgi:hypothetical protein
VTTKAKTAVLIVGAAAAFLALSWTAHHYWDEFFYLYSSARYTPRQLLRLDAATDLFPQGYFSGKIGHVVLLHWLVGILGSGRIPLAILQGGAAALMLATVGAGYGVFRELLGAREARRTTLVLLFLPLTLYLAYKLLSEVPSLLLSTLACWAFLRALRRGRRRSEALLLAAATVALALGMLCRVTSVLTFVGLVVGLVAVRELGFPRGAVLARAAAVGLGALAIHAGVLQAMGGSELRVLLLAGAVAKQAQGFERIYAFLFFLQTFAVLLPLALHRPWRAPVRTAGLWLLVTVLPMLSGHEPRYYAPGLLPLAMLCAVGLDRLASLVPEVSRRWVWAGALGLLALVDRAALLPLMPWEVDEGSLTRVVQEISRRHPQATILVPWASDYCFLRYRFPGLPVRLAMSALPASRYPSQGHWGSIAPIDQRWAGAALYVGSMATLARTPAPWYYVSWSYNPVMLQVRTLLEDVDIHALGDPHRTGWHDHRAGSWIWTDARLAHREIGGVGQYEVFLVVPRPQSGLTTSITSSPPTTKTRSSGPGSTMLSPVKLPNAGSKAI